MSYVVTSYKNLSETVHFKSELDNMSSPCDNFFLSRLHLAILANSRFLYSFQRKMKKLMLLSSLQHQWQMKMEHLCGSDIVAAELQYCVDVGMQRRLEERERVMLSETSPGCWPLDLSSDQFTAAFRSRAPALSHVQHITARSTHSHCCDFIRRTVSQAS